MLITLFLNQFKTVSNITNLNAVKNLLDANKNYHIEYTIDDVFKYDQNDLQGDDTSWGNAFTWQLMNGNTTIVSGTDMWAADNARADNDFTGAQFANVSKIKLTLNSLAEWIDYTDDKTYTGKLTIKDENNNAVATIDLSNFRLLISCQPDSNGRLTRLMKAFMLAT